MAIATVITRGYGNVTFAGSIALLITRGFSIGAAVVTPTTFAYLCQIGELSSAPVVNRADLVGEFNQTAVIDGEVSINQFVNLVDCI